MWCGAGRRCALPQVLDFISFWAPALLVYFVPLGPDPAWLAAWEVGFGRMVVSETEASNLSVNLV